MITNPANGLGADLIMGAEMSNEGAQTRSSPTLERQSLHDRLIPLLRDMILVGALPPGEALSEAVLCERFGVSRTPLREALKVLASEGLVELRAHRAPLVTPVALEEVRATFVVLAPLEKLAGRLATERATEAEHAALGTFHARMIAAFEAGDRARYLRLNHSFHLQFARFSGNSVLMSTISLLQDRILRARAAANRDLGRWHQSTQEHEALLTAFCHRDSDLVARLLEQHLAQTATAVIAALTQREPSR